MPQISISKALLGLLLISQVTAHSWVEQLMVIAPNGTFVGQPGFPRGNSPRGVGFNEAQMVHLLPPGRTEVLPTDNMCSQTQQNFEANPVSPRLKASPGQAVALRYQENGHVSLPQNIPGKPQNGGTIFVYGTTNPQPNDALMSIHRVWNAAGTGGDGRGRLLATSNFDDGQCYQINGQAISQQRQKEFPHSAAPPQGADLWCQSDILLPSDLQAGKALTLYWVWDWPTMPGTPGLLQGKQEIYTTCMDIEIQAPSGQQGVLNAKSFSFAQQDIGNAAVPDQLKQLGNANAVANPAAIPFQGQPASGSSQGGPSKSPTATSQQVAASSQSGSKPTSAASTTSSANNTPSGSNPASGQQSGGGRQSGPPGIAPVPGPPQGQGQGQNNGNGRGGASQTGNGSSRGGDNGTRPPGSSGPGVFAPGAIPEFGTGSGTSINGPNRQQPNNGANAGSNSQAGSDPRPSTPATITAVNPAPIVTVTQDAEVTVTQFVTVGAGQGRSNQSESFTFSTSSTSNAPITSESTTASSTASSTSSSTTSTSLETSASSSTPSSSSSATSGTDVSTMSTPSSIVPAGSGLSSATTALSSTSSSATSTPESVTSTPVADSTAVSSIASSSASPTSDVSNSNLVVASTTTSPTTTSASTSSISSSSSSETSDTSSSTDAVSSASSTAALLETSSASGSSSSEASQTATTSSTTSSAASSTMSSVATPSSISTVTTEATSSSMTTLESSSTTSSLMTTSSSSFETSSATSSSLAQSTIESTPSASSVTSTTATSGSLVTPIPRPGAAPAPSPASDSGPIVVVPVHNKPRNLVRQLLAPLFPRPAPVITSQEMSQANYSPSPVRSAAPELSSSAPCSKAHPAYQLRARAPLGWGVDDSEC